MKIVEVKEEKRKYMPLLLIGDEQESMIERYIDRGRLFLLDENGIKACAVVTDEGGGRLEIKNIAVEPRFQRQGFGKYLVDFICDEFSESYDELWAGTGEGTENVKFYEECGFVPSHSIRGFFTDNYDHPIFENGVRLTDMIYLKKNLYCETVKISERRELMERASLWFSEKWDLPPREYYDSMEAAVKAKGKTIPQWYLVLNRERKIIAGAGAIDNDFHKRPDLSPNICALFVDEGYRGRGLARELLYFIRKDLGSMRFEKVYLITDHKNFYEKCGWEFFVTVDSLDGSSDRMYKADTIASGITTDTKSDTC